jgi:hypothetical protein
MFLVVFIDKSDRFADLPYSVVTKMASVREPFRPDQSTISTKIMAKTPTNNEKLFASEIITISKQPTDRIHKVPDDVAKPLTNVAKPLANVAKPLADVAKPLNITCSERGM